MPDIDIAGIFIAFIVLLFSLTVHETAHAWTADRLGDPTARLLGRVSLNPTVHADPVGTVLFPLLGMISGLPLLGWAKPVPVVTSRLRHPRRDFMLVAAAGPVSNLMVAIVAALLIRVVILAPVDEQGPQIVQPIVRMLLTALRMNIMLALFNLIPIPPLDGGNILTGLLPRAMAVKYDSFIRPYGFLVLYALILTNALQRIVYVPAGVLTSALLYGLTS